MTQSRQRRIVWTGMLVSIVASIAFNIMGTALETDSMPAKVMSLVWSLLALISVEIMVKVKLPAGRKVKRAWQIAKFGGVGFVAVVSMITSYGHAYSTLSSWNQGAMASTCAPLAIDGAMVLCGVMLLAIPQRTTRRTRKPASKTTRRLRAA